MESQVQAAVWRHNASVDRRQGILLVFSFGFWAVMLGLLPVLAVGALLSE